MAHIGFKALERQLAHRPGVRNPGALTAYIGRRKYGEQAMERASKSGKSLRGHKSKRSQRRENLAAFTGGRY